MIDKDTKDFELQFNIEIGKGTFLIDFQHSESLKECLISDFIETHQLSQTETYQALKKMYDSYFEALTELQVNDYKDEFNTFIDVIDRKLSKIKNDSAKIDVLNVFLEKRYGIRHALTMYKSKLPDNELQKQHSNFNKRLDNYLDSKIKELSTNKSNQDNQILAIQEAKENTNPYFKIFTDYGFKVFERYKQEKITQSTLSAQYGFLFDTMQKENLIHDTITRKYFYDWLVEKYDISIGNSKLSSTYSDHYKEGYDYIKLTIKTEQKQFTTI